MRSTKGPDPLGPVLPVIREGLNVRRYGAGGKYGGGSSWRTVYKPCPICEEEEVAQPERPDPETVLDEINEALSRPLCYNCRSVARDVHKFFRVLSFLSEPPRGLWIDDYAEEAAMYERLRLKAQEEADSKSVRAKQWEEERDAFTL